MSAVKSRSRGLSYTNSRPRLPEEKALAHHAEKAIEAAEAVLKLHGRRCDCVGCDECHSFLEAMEEALWLIRKLPIEVDYDDGNYSVGLAT